MDMPYLVLCQWHHKEDHGFYDKCILFYKEKTRQLSGISYIQRGQCSENNHDSHYHCSKAGKSEETKGKGDRKEKEDKGKA